MMKCIQGFICAFLLGSLGGCHYYQEYRGLRGDADLKQERAELMKAQRECVQRFEDTPEKAEKHCGMYKEMLQTISPGHR